MVLADQARHRPSGRRYWRSTLAVVIACVAAGCGGAGSDVQVPTDPAPVALFAPSGTEAGSDKVRLTAEPGSGGLITVHVVLGGPTTSQDLYSFAFDLVLGDPAVVRYESGTAVLGTVLQPTPGQEAIVMASQQGNRVVVGVTKNGGDVGNGVTDGEPTIVSLTFRVVDRGNSSLTIQGPPEAPASPRALDASGAPVASLQFDLLPATLIGS